MRTPYDLAAEDSFDAAAGVSPSYEQASDFDSSGIELLCLVSPVALRKEDR